MRPATEWRRCGRLPNRTAITTSPRSMTTSGIRARCGSKGGLSATTTGRPRCGIASWNWKIRGRRAIWWWKKLAVPLEAMAGQEERLALSMEKQRRIHSRCPIVKGRRVVEEESQVRLTSLGREIAQYRRQMKSIQAEWGKDLKRLRNYEQQWL